MSLQFSTIGVYGYTEEDFFQALITHNINIFCDIRLRRGMRGSKYAFVNSTYLQNKLKTLKIAYVHHKELAPSKAIRDKQKEADKTEKIKKRERNTLSKAFITAYQETCLANFDSETFVARLSTVVDTTLEKHPQKVVLFCVEHDPTACHRSLVAQKLSADLNIDVEHIIL